MSIFTRTKPTLTASLSAKSAELRDKQDKKAAAARNLSTAASEALTESATAATHASAVERALSILEDAGVEL